MRRIAIIINSLTDLPQCKKGLEWLSSSKKITVDKIYIASQHLQKHTLIIQGILTTLVTSETPPDAIIVGADWSNHLTGYCEAFLRYTLKNETIQIIGVAFKDRNKKNNPEIRKRHNEAAFLSITEVPATKVIFSSEQGEPFQGSQGFLKACLFAHNGKFPKIVSKEFPHPLTLTLEEAIKKTLAVV